MRPEGVIDHETWNRPEDDVVLRVAGCLKYVGVVLHPLAEKRAQLETGDPLAEIQGRRRRPGKHQREKAERQHNSNEASRSSLHVSLPLSHLAVRRYRRA